MFRFAMIIRVQTQKVKNNVTFNIHTSIDTPQNNKIEFGSETGCSRYHTRRYFFSVSVGTFVQRLCLHKCHGRIPTSRIQSTMLIRFLNILVFIYFNLKTIQKLYFATQKLNFIYYHSSYGELVYLHMTSLTFFWAFEA